MRRSAKRRDLRSYTAAGFGSDHQRQLREALIALSSRGCHVVMSNSTAAEITTLYERSREVETAGLRCYRVAARRAINSNALRRGQIDEYVIANSGTAG